MDIKDVFGMEEGSVVELKGWIANKSSMGSLIFITLRDGSSYIQLVGKKNFTDKESLEKMEKVTIESAVSIKGKLRIDPRAPNGREVIIDKFDIIALAEEWPITKSVIRSSRFLYDNRHLSIRGKKASSILKIRSEFITASIEFFIKQGFTLITAPTIVGTAVEGGATLFDVDYFGKKAYLTQSAQLYEEAAICSFGKVFTVQPAFRAEKSKTAKHLTEFIMIEAEVAFNTQEDNLRLQEDMLNYVASKIVENRSYELSLLERRFEVPEKPFPRISYDEAREISIKHGIEFEWGEDIPSEAEKIISKQFDKPFFITGYPVSARSFYHKANGNITLSADMIAPNGFGEIASGGQRIDDYNTLLARIREHNLPIESFRWYLDLRRYGMPPHAGFGIGVERSIRWICNLKHIRAASLFPRTITRVYP